MKKQKPAKKKPRKKPQPKLESQWRDRIVGHGKLDPKTIIANDRNWRTHPPSQRRALVAVLKKVGWVQSVIINRNTNQMIDGHLRVEEAIQGKEPFVPVNYVDLTEEEEKEILLTFDPIGMMAHENAQVLQDLTREVQGRLADVEKDTDGAMEGVHDLLKELETTSVIASGGNQELHSAVPDDREELIDGDEVQNQVDNARPRCPICDQILKDQKSQDLVSRAARSVVG